MDLSFESKVALVTGASSGVGLATAKAFAEAGASVVLADNNRPLKKYSHSRNIDRETRAVAHLAGSGREIRLSWPRGVHAGYSGWECASYSCSNGGHHRLDAQNIYGPSQIVDECREAELSTDIVEALHQKGAVVHPLLDAAEGMLGEFATAIEAASPSAEPASIYSFEK
jgi:2-polyprenyl-6-methoxyphenol hydroxylase-like FAD-dependent oxidoreductase